MAMVLDKMGSQTFQNFYYAPYLYENYFNSANSANIRTNVIGAAGITNVGSQFTISADPQFGMENDKALTYWINATI
jgi:Tfp pilus assembly protein PilE